MDGDLHARIEALHATLVARDGANGELVALMPCEPAIGAVVVACWRTEEGDLLELVRLDDASVVDDQVAVRESLVLLAMVETVEELASFGALGEARAALGSWPLDAEADELSGALAGARERAVAAIDALAAIAPSDVRMARPQRLDELGAALRGLEQAWTTLEAAAEQWSDAQLAAGGAGDPVVAEQVQELWRTLGLVRRGPLARPVSAALHEAREAGAAMAAAVAGAQAGASPAT
jgi:hypothetical protein